MEGKMQMKNNNGITLIALVITMIIMLILAAISVTFLSGDNSLIKKSGEAKEGVDVKNEKDIINLAITAAINSSRYGELVAEELANELNTIYRGKLTATVKSNNLVRVVFTSGRKYDIDADGNVTKKKDVVIAEGLTIGSDVIYEPTGGTYGWNENYASNYWYTIIDLYSTENGTGENMRNINWKVFKIDEEEGKIQLIPSSPIGSVNLQGAPGYNNAVQLLNNACSELYSYSEKEIIARSINMDDIESLLDGTKLQNAKDEYSHNNTTSFSYLNTNDQVSTPYSNSNNRRYPRIYEEEIKSVINGNEKLEGLGLSDPGSKLYSRAEETSLTNQTGSNNSSSGYLDARINIQPYQTYYYWSQALSTRSNFANSTTASAYSNMLKGSYWVASRCVNCSSSTCGFYVRSINNGDIGGEGIFSSSGGSNNVPQGLFPIVTLNSELIIQDSINFKVDL